MYQLMYDVIFLIQTQNETETHITVRYIHRCTHLHYKMNNKARLLQLYNEKFLKTILYQSVAYNCIKFLLFQLLSVNGILFNKK